jgi:CheY-like chemotaxis protein
MSSPSIRPTILLVDDEAYFRVFVGKVLTVSICCVVVEARNGQEAVEQSQQCQPDLILLDINMPRVDGVKALEQIRALHYTAPIVMLTSISEEAVVEECVNLGASYFIRKDVRADELKTELQAMLRMFFPAAQLNHEQSPPPPA